MRLLILFIVLLASPSFAQDRDNAFRATDYPLPRFVSLGKGEAYVRAGPGRKYPIQWVYKRKGIPVEIILEFDHWRKIRDQSGDEGWLHKSLLSGKRSARVIGDDDIVNLYRTSEKTAKLSAQVEHGVVVRLRECDANWCYVDAQGYKGWIEKKNLWGIYKNEIIEK